jgi:hypothetical protein
VDLAEIPLIEAGKFYNVQSARKLRPFIRDDLLEPADSKKKLRVYGNDILVSSRAAKPARVLRASPKSTSGMDLLSRTIYEAKAAGGLPRRPRHGFVRCGVALPRKRARAAARVKR